MRPSASTPASAASTPASAASTPASAAPSPASAAPSPASAGAAHPDRARKVLVTGGGTAGHVNPALAIARALRDRGHDVELVGAQRGLEARLVPAAGFEITLLPGRGIARSFGPRAVVDNIGAVIGLFRAGVQAIALLRRLRPAAVVAVGGYASAACGLAAVLCRVPVIVHEQNAVPGAANRLLARFAKASAVSFPETPLPRSVVVGNPVRAEIFEATHRPRPDGRRQLLVFGGSLGALSINRAAARAVERWRDRDDLAVHHVVGSRDWERFAPGGDDAADIEGADLVYDAVEYEDEMPERLASADLVVCRAGSGTCFELAATARPAVIVPSLVVTGGQQLANAERVASVGGGVVIRDDELDADRLVAEVDALLTDPDRRARMSDAVATLAAPDAAGAVADLVDAHGRG